LTMRTVISSLTSAVCTVPSPGPFANPVSSGADPARGPQEV
jgi:hypothetical protein